MGFFGKFKKLSKKHLTHTYKTVEQSSDIQERASPDECFEKYYATRAHLHIDRIMAIFNRETPEDLDVALIYMRQLGLMHPYADSIKYLKNMKKAATWKVAY
jgi:hypothetical protein